MPELDELELVAAAFDATAAVLDDELDELPQPADTTPTTVKIAATVASFLGPVGGG